MTDAPPELPVGQDDEPPNRLLAVIVAIRVLNECETRLKGIGDDDDADLLLRLAAIRSVLRRLRHRWEAAHDDG